MTNIYLVGRPVIIHENDIKLFMYVYEHFRKKYKNKNQFEVAMEIKKTFKYIFQVELDETRAIDKYESMHDLDLKRESKIIALINITRKKYHKNYCNENYVNAFDIAFSNLNNYFSSASPAAIVQMKKRLVKNK